MPRLTDAEFIAAWHAAGGSPAAMARATGLAESGIYKRRDRLAAQGFHLPTAGPGGEVRPRWAYPRVAEDALTDGTALVFSDVHVWPGEAPSTGLRALLALAAALQPRLLIANGDILDGARISRHPRIGWARPPSVADELAELQRVMHAIRDAAPRARRRRTVGNHDVRFDNYLSSQAGEVDGVAGTRLADHLPDWPESWSVRVNRGLPGDLIVKHRLKGGIHAAWNNVRDAGGPSIATGHLHRCEARAFRGYGTHRRWGIETGTLSTHPQDTESAGAGPFEYLENAPTEWCEGFAVLTWRKGVLLPPEFCSVEGGAAYFRGERVAYKATRRGGSHGPRAA